MFTRHGLLYISVALTLSTGGCRLANGGGEDSQGSDGDFPCEVLSSGTYAAAGSCFGMGMTVQLDMDAASCAFTLDQWSMTGEQPPSGGSIDGDQVTLSGGDFDGCTGTVTGSDVSGVCPDACAWTLDHAN